MKKYTKNDRKKINSIIYDGDCLLLMTNKGGATIGTHAEMLTALTMAVKKLHEEAKISEKVIRNSIDLGFKTDEELEKETLKCLRDLLKSMKGK